MPAATEARRSESELWRNVLSFLLLHFFRDDLLRRFRCDLDRLTVNKGRSFISGSNARRTSVFARARTAFEAKLPDVHNPWNLTKLLEECSKIVIGAQHLHFHWPFAVDVMIDNRLRDTLLNLETGIARRLLYLRKDVFNFLILRQHLLQFVQALLQRVSFLF